MAVERKTARYRTQGTLQSCRLFSLGKAIDEQDKSPVLVRRFATDLFADDADWQQFRQTLQEFSQVTVSGLLPVRQIGGQTRQPWLVIGGTDGVTLRDRLAAESSARLLDWLESVANTLTELHASGHVHGRVQPDAIFFTEDDRPRLDEIASTHALCAWDIRRHDLPQNLIGELFSSAYLAPELRNGGEVTPQSDQYSLAIVLVECLTGQSLDVVNLIGSQGCETALAYLAAEAPKARRSAIELLRPALMRALADDPQQRFPNCRDFFIAVRQTQHQRSRRRRLQFATMVGMVFVVLAVISGVRELDRRNLAKERIRLDESLRHQARLDERKKQFRSEIARKYQSGFPTSKLMKLSLLADFDELLSAPESTDFVEILLNEQSTSSGARSRSAPALLSKPLSQGTPPKISLTFDSTFEKAQASPAVASSPNETKEAFIFSETGQFARLSVPAKVTWTMVVTLPASARPRKSDSVRGALIDGDGNILGEKQTASLSTTSYSSSTSLKGVLPSTSNLKYGDTLRAKLWLLENSQEIEWPQSIAYRVGEVITRTHVVEVNPLNVKESGFQLSTGVDVEAGESVRVVAAGSMLLGSPNVYAALKIERQHIPPEGILFQRHEMPAPWVGVSFSGPMAVQNAPGNTLLFDRRASNSKSLFSVNNRYGALLIKIGNNNWIPYKSQSSLQPSLGCTITNGSIRGTISLSLDRIVKIAQRNTTTKKDRSGQAIKGEFSAENARSLNEKELQDFWTGDGGFQVTIVTRSVRLPSPTSESTKQKLLDALSF